MHVDTVRELLGGFGSLVLTATSYSAPTGTDPRTRRQLSSGAALLADDLVAGVGLVRQGPGGGRATGAWLLGQLLSGARAAGDDRRLPPRLARRAAAAAASAEIAEIRDADAALRHGTTLSACGDDTFASWFDDASRTGDALHVLVRHAGADPAEEAALLAEPLPDSSDAGGALANSRGDRLTLGEHLVRRWITVEATGSGSHPGLRLATDADLTRLLPSIASASTAGAAETRARVMLELSRTSAYAMQDASTTRIYTRATAPLEGQVADWLSAMRANVDAAVASPVLATTRSTPYATATPHGMQPWLDSLELTGVVGALAVDTGMGMRAKDPGPAYQRLIEKELRATAATADTGQDVRPDAVRLGFLDRAASAALVGLARRQDDLTKTALQGLAEAGHVVAEIRSGNVAGLASMVKTYIDAGTTRTAADDLVIALVRPDVELAQTERDDSRRAELAARLAAMTGGWTDLRSSPADGARSGPVLPTADGLSSARSAEVRAAWVAFRDEKAQALGESVINGLKDRAHPPDLLGVSEDRGVRLPQLEQLPRGKSRGVHTVADAQAMQELFEQLTEGSTRHDLPHYDGDWFERPDGVQVGMRGSSLSGGATIDVRYPDNKIRKVHIK